MYFGRLRAEARVCAEFSPLRARLVSHMFFNIDRAWYFYFDKAGENIQSATDSRCCASVAAAAAAAAADEFST